MKNAGFVFPIKYYFIIVQSKVSPLCLQQPTNKNVFIITTEATINKM